MDLGRLGIIVFSYVNWSTLIHSRKSFDEQDELSWTQAPVLSTRRLKPPVLHPIQKMREKLKPNLKTHLWRYDRRRTNIFIRFHTHPNLQMFWRKPPKLEKGIKPTRSHPPHSFVYIAGTPSPKTHTATSGFFQVQIGLHEVFWSSGNPYTPPKNKRLVHLKLPPSRNYLTPERKRRNIDPKHQSWGSSR